MSSKFITAMDEAGMMPQRPSAHATPASHHHENGVKLVAKTLYRQLRQGGYEVPQIIGVATELLGLLTDELRVGRSAKS